MKVVLLHDDVGPAARLDELDVFVQADAVGAALATLGHNAERLACSLDLRTLAHELNRREADLVFNLVESVGGHGRLIHLAPALLDALSLPYTGASAEAMFLTSSKLLAKQVLKARRVATPAWFQPGRGAALSKAVSARCIIKSVWEHASVGMEDDAVLQSARRRGLEQAIHERAARLGGEAFAEAYIAGREFNLSLLAREDGVEVLPPAEIRFVDYPADKPKVVGYRAKWESESFEYSHTPRCFDFPAADGPLLEELAGLARRCWEVFCLSGYARVDFRVDSSGKPWVLEVNTNPCLSPDAGFAAAAERGGLAFEKVVARVLAAARRRFAAVVGS